MLAGCLDYIEDYPAAGEMYRTSFKIAQQEGPLYVSAVHELYGVFLFSTGDLEQGSDHLQRAIDTIPAGGGEKLIRRKFNAIALRATQHIRYRYDIGIAAELLESAKLLAGQYKTTDFKSEAESDLKDYFGQLREAQSEVKISSKKRPGIARPS